MIWSAHVSKARGKCQHKGIPDNGHKELAVVSNSISGIKDSKCEKNVLLRNIE